MSINRKQKADLFMLLITIIWSGTFIIIKNALFDVPRLIHEDTPVIIQLLSEIGTIAINVFLFTLS